MDDFELKLDLGGADIEYTNKKPAPFNPLIRQRPNCRKMVTALIVYIASAALLAVVLPKIFDIHWAIIAGVWSLVYFCIISKRAVIWLVRLYQYKAPDRVRLKCVYYPSCSEYMILAVQKFGTIRGVFKGWRRLSRCHAPNGGEDFP